MPESKRPGEFELIDRYFRPLATDPAAFGLTDDAATIALPPAEELVVKVDLVAEGIHFFAEDPPQSVARKALRVNLSDLAGKGAEPVSYVMALALRSDWAESWLAGFAEGLAGDQARYGISLIGGDTSAASGGTTIAITAFGRVPAGRMVRRSGARPGDVLFVSGTLGDAALGLKLRRGRLDPALAGGGEGHLLERYLHPEPRVPLAPVLRRYASAAMDVSDGLAADLGHMCKASDVGAKVEADSLPLSSAAQAVLSADSSSLGEIIAGGDDYEILAAVPPAEAESFRAAAAAAGVSVTAIGRIEPGSGPPRILARDGNPVPAGRAGYVHF